MDLNVDIIYVLDKYKRLFNESHKSDYLINLQKSINSKGFASGFEILWHLIGVLF